MAVHRISDPAERLAQQIAKAQGETLNEFLSNLVLMYAAGLTWHRDEFGRADLTQWLRIMEEDYK